MLLETNCLIWNFHKLQCSDANNTNGFLKCFHQSFPVHQRKKSALVKVALGAGLKLWLDFT